MTNKKRTTIHWVIISLASALLLLDSARVLLHNPIANHVAAGNLDKVEAWLAQGQNDQSELLGGLLSVAVANEKTEMIAYLLQSGADPNELDLEMKTPLYKAVMIHDPEIVGILLDGGGDPHLREFGPTPLELALSGEFFPVIEEFLKRGVVPNEQHIDRINDPGVRDSTLNYRR